MGQTSRRRRSPLRPLAPLGLATLTISLAAAFGPEDLSVAAAGSAVDETSTIVHVLDRTGYGPRPGDVERVREIGVAAYIEQQLHPERLPDREVERQLARFQTLDLTTTSIVRQFHIPAQDARRRRREEAARAAEQDATGADTRPGADLPMSPEDARRRQRDVPEEIRRERLLHQELMDQKLLRAVASERQLQESLVDFWFNHFNVSVQKGPLIQPFMIEYERDVIRPDVLGRFRDLLGAVAESPAMLIYLDNWLSSDPDAPDLRPHGRRRERRPAGLGVRGGRRFGFMDPRSATRDRRAGNRMDVRPPVQPGRRDGLNENYARELLELHTLGVDGGYMQEDVVEVARALTGWTIAPLPLGGGYRFEPRLHENGTKTVLGHTIDGGGKRDGEEVLDLLARHPSTASFIATKLASRFVADDPPAALVARTAARFLATDGNLREVMRTILTSPEFLASEAHRAKVKTPLEYVVSSVRALDADVTSGLQLAHALVELGMPLYACQPPTGYSDRADAWVNAGALLARMNFAVALVAGQVRGVRVELGGVDGAGAADPDDLVDPLVLDQASEATRATLAAAASPEQRAILTLGSPEFQRQ